MRFLQEGLYGQSGAAQVLLTGMQGEGVEGKAMIRVTTGNQLDVVYDYEDGKRVLRGLRRWKGQEVIPLPDPNGLIHVLQSVVDECERDAKV